VTFEGHFFDLLTVITLRAQLTRDLLAIAKFLVQYSTEFRITITIEILR